MKQSHHDSTAERFSAALLYCEELLAQPDDASLSYVRRF
jgi:hypothetical protein